MNTVFDVLRGLGIALVGVAVVYVVWESPLVRYKRSRRAVRKGRGRDAR